MQNNENRAGTKFVKDLYGMKFVIPSYQRGYRWTESEVHALLDDIFKLKSNKDQTVGYCLQPLIVKKDNRSGEFEVVDGQQRLTTIFIVFCTLTILSQADVSL